MAHDQEHARDNAAAWMQDIARMVDALGGNDQDAARDEIQDSILSVEVRSGWQTLDRPKLEAVEYQIMLTTGGPALRITGALGNHNEPHSAELQYQDWGTPWTRFPADEKTLKQFVQCFYFGE